MLDAFLEIGALSQAQTMLTLTGAACLAVLLQSISALRRAKRFGGAVFRLFIGLCAVGACLWFFLFQALRPHF